MKKDPKRGKERPFSFPFKQDFAQAAFDPLCGGFLQYTPVLMEVERHLRCRGA